PSETRNARIIGAVAGAVATAIVGRVIKGNAGAGVGMLIGLVGGWYAPVLTTPFQRFQDRLEARYSAILAWVLANRKKTLAGAGAIFVASIFAAGRVTNTFIPNTDSTEFQVTLEMP